MAWSIIKTLRCLKYPALRGFKIIKYRFYLINAAVLFNISTAAIAENSLNCMNTVVVYDNNKVYLYKQDKSKLNMISSDQVPADKILSAATFSCTSQILIS